MSGLPDIVDRKAECELLGAIYEAIREPRHSSATSALGVLRWEPYHVLLACADTMSVFCGWRHAQVVGHGPPPEEALVRHGLADDVPVCGDCLLRLDEIVERLRDVGERRLEVIRKAEEWVEERATYDA